MIVTVDGSRVDFSEVDRTELFYVELEIETDAGAAFDLTGLDLLMHIRESTYGPVLLELSTDNGRIQILDAAQGQIALEIDAADMMTLPRGDYVHDLAIRTSDNTKLFRGSLSIMGGVTRE